MKFFAETAEVSEIRLLSSLGQLDGVTANPRLIVKSGRRMEDVIAEAYAITRGPVRTEVVATEVDAMITEGRALAALATDVLVKVPLTEDGLTRLKGIGHQGDSDLIY